MNLTITKLNSISVVSKIQNGLLSLFMFSMILLSSVQLDAQCDPSCNPGETCIESFCACDDGSGNVIITVNFNNFPAGCGSGYDVGILYENTGGGTSIVSAMGQLGPQVVFGPVTNMADPSLVSISGINNTCTLNGEPFCAAGVTMNVSQPMVITPPADATEAACQTQAAIDAAFADWLDDVSVSGGCNVVITDNNNGAPDACGGTTTVTFTATDDCGSPVMASADFTVTDADPVVLTPPADQTEVACQDPADIEAAFNAWLASATFTGGCNATISNNSDSAGEADPCGGSVTIIWTVSSDCEGDVTASAVFTVEFPDPVDLNVPADQTEDECQTQAAIDAAFAAWLAQASMMGGCNAVMTNDAAGAPDACTGGTVTVTWTVESDCDNPVMKSADFTVTPAPPVVLTAPADATEPECQDQAAIDAAFAAWLASYNVTGGCNTTVTNDAGAAPPFCGGSVLVTWTATDDCGSPMTDQATFSVDFPDPIMYDAPMDQTEAACQTQADIDMKFNAWLNIGGSSNLFSQSFTQGQPSPHCGEWRTFRASLLTSGYTSLTINGSNDPVGLTLSDPVLVQQIADALRDGVNIEVVDGNGVEWGVGQCGYGPGGPTGDPAYTLYASTGNTTSCSCDSPGSGSYVVRPCIDVWTTNPNWGGINTATCSGPSQIMTVEFFGGISGGCNVVVTNDNTGAPDACGGSTTVTWTISSDCEPDITTSATFTVDPAPAVVLTVPGNQTEMECQDQAAIDAAFDAWLMSAMVSGGCNPMMTNDNTGAPDACGGSTTVTWTVTSDCEPPVMNSSTFTVTAAPPVSLSVPADQTEASCQDQATIDAAFSAWVASATFSGGCNASMSTTGANCIVNGGFETGDFTGWTTMNSGSAQGFVINDGSFDPPGPGTTQAPLSGSFDVMSTQTGPGLNIISSGFVLPSTVPSPFTLSWVDRIFNFGGSFSDPNQEVRINLLDAGMALIGTVWSTNPGDALSQPGPNARSFDVEPLLAAYAGTMVYLQIEQQDNQGYFNYIIDDITLLKAPEFCGGSATVTWTVTSDCEPPVQMSSTFTVTDAPPLVLTVPADQTEASCQTQTDIDAAFAAFVASASASGDCNVTISAMGGSPVMNNILINGDFETGDMTGWTNSGFGDTGTCPSANRDFNVSNVNSTGCSNVGLPINGGFSNYNMLDGTAGTLYELSQVLTVPAGISAATLSWNHKYATSYSGAQRTLAARIYDAAGTTLLGTIHSFAFPLNTGGLVGPTAVSENATALLQSLEGQTVTLRFEINIPQTWSGPAGYAIDDIELNVDYLSADACGDIVTVTWTATGDCDSMSDSAVFTVTPPDPIVVGCEDRMIAPDQSQAAADAALAQWISDIQTNTTGGCSTQVTYNLLKNGSAQSGLSNWTIISQSGDGWNAAGGEFRTSYGSCPENTATHRMAQEIDLVAAGYSPAYLDGAPNIEVGERVRSLFLNALCSPPDPRDNYYVRYELRDAAHTPIATFTIGTPGAPAQIGLTPLDISHIFSGYGAGARYLYFEHGGSDKGYWDGHYGAAFGKAFVNMPDLPDSAPDVCTGGMVMASFVGMDDCGNMAACDATFTVPAATIGANPMGAASVCIGTEVSVFGKPFGGSGSYSHAWTVITGTGSFVNANDQNPKFIPTSSGNVVIEYTVTDNVSGCTASGQVTIFVQDECDFEFKVDDPCVCNNDADVNEDNGTFMELITITGPNGAALPAGQTWAFTALTGAYSASPFNEENIPGPQGVLLGPGQTMSYCNNVAGCTVYQSAGGNILTAPFGSYYLVFSHVDHEGYCGTVQGPDPDDDLDPTTANPANTVLSLCNTCFYPQPSILNMPSTICITSSPITLQGVPVNTGEGTWNGEATFVGGDPPYSYAVGAGLTDNGDGTATFDPAAAGVGTHILSYTFEDQPAVGGTEPGCFQAIQAPITVTPNVDPSFTDDDDDNIVCLGQVVNLTGVPGGGIFTGIGVIDNGDGTATFTANAVGTYVVTYSYDNGCAGSYSEIYETDNIAPTIECPADVVTTNDPGVCGAFVEYALPVVDDNCGPLLLAGAPMELVSNGGFETGDFTSWTTSMLGGSGCNGPDWTVYSGATAPNQCWFGLDLTPSSGTFASYTGFDGPGPITFFMQQAIAIPTNIVSANLSWLETYQFLLLSVTGGSGTMDRVLNIDLYDAAGVAFVANLTSKNFPVDMDTNSGWAPNNADVTAALQAYEGQNLTLRISAYVPENFTGPADYSIDDISLQVTTNSALQQIAGLPSGSVFPVGTTTNIFVVTDEAGNTASCSFDVTVTDDEDPMVTCPADVSITTSSLGSTGDCAGQYTWTHPIPSDNCSLLEYRVTYTNPDGTIDGPTDVYPYSVQNYPGGNNPTPPNRNFDLGTTAVTYFVEDIHGNTTTCSFDVTVTDDEAPMFTNCPAGATFDVFTNDCQTSVIWSIPTATDNCSVTVAQTGGPLYGSLVSPGLYTIEYTATDGAGLTDLCTFNINVIDTEDPVIVNCPFNNQTIYVDDNCESELPDYTTEINAGENCPGFLTTQDPLPGTIYTVGDVVTVTITVTDASGNSATCVFDVDVVDEIDPTIECPDDIEVSNDPGICGAVVEFEDPVIDDNCGILLLPIVEEFTFAGAPQSFVVPPGVTEIFVEAWGAEGGIGGSSNQPGGLGGFASGVISVTPGQVIDIMVGGQGTTFNGADANNAGGFNGGGDGGFDGSGQIENGGGGGGSSDIIVSGTKLLVAGGGGGGGGGFFGPSGGGNAGGLVGAMGSDQANAIGGAGGSQVAGGLAGSLARGATNGSFGQGGNGSTNQDAWGSGGGGGGYYGGAGGTSITDHGAGHSAGGGGGSSYVGGATMTNTVAGVWAGNGFVRLTMESGSLIQTAGLPSGSIFPVGTTTNTFVVTDNSGNTASCSFDVIVNDTEMPAIACPANAVITTSSLGSTGDCAGQFAWSHPLPTDNCGIAQYSFQYFNPDGTIDGPYAGNQISTILIDNQANRHFDVGTTTVTYYVTDLHGNTNTCSFTVTVSDDEDPEFVNCPTPGSTTDVFTNDCVTSVIWSIPVATDNCYPYVMQTAGPNYGDIVGPGMYTITYVATDGSGNTDECSFVINVIDTENPVITCPQQSVLTILDTDDDVCEALVTNDDLDADVSENCDIITLTHDYTSATSADNTTLNGHTFPLGNTTVVWTATDGAGNSATCETIVTVVDDQGPEFDCPGPMDVAGCAGVVPNLIEGLVGTDNCGGNVTFTQSPEAGSLFGPDPGDMILVTITATDENGNTTTCTVELTIIDTEMPYFVNCPVNQLVYGNDPDQCSAAVNWSIPVAHDNCSQVMSPSQIVQTAGLPPGSTFPVGGPYTIEYTATDDDGNTAVCSWTFIVEDVQEPEILVGKPQDETVECDNVPDPLVLNPNDVEDNCTEDPTIAFNQVSTQDPNPANCGHYDYTLTNTWTVTDEYGNAQVWNQVVTVEDTQAPIITVPLDVTVECMGPYAASSFTCDPSTGSYAPTANQAMFGVASAEDNCAPAEFICIEYTETFEPGSCGYTGVITRTWTATDPCGNESSGVQKITIQDVTPPEFECMDITIELDEMGMATIGANDVIVGGIAGVTDACSDPADLNYQMSQTKFTCDDVGVVEVTLVVTDDCGNSAACLLNVTVQDNIAPTITCPGNVFIHLDAGECRTTIGQRASATDNCEAVITYSPDVEDFFEIGQTTVTATATDPSGNTASCTFNVNVYEYVPTSDELACNNSINLSLDGNCEAVINADMLLEGGNYRCYENYCITITDLNDIPHANYFTLADVGKTFKVTITDCNGSNNSCWGYVNIEEKLIPVIECPADVTINCNEDAEARNNAGRLITGEVALLSCEPGAVIGYEDNFVDNGACATPRGVIYRTWRVTDTGGNEVTCTQTITIAALSLAAVEFPANLEGADALTCKAVAGDPSLVHPNNTGYPTLNGVDINLSGNLCMSSLNYTDEIFDICDGSYEILRTWKVRNMCLPVSASNPRVGIQVIKVLDVEGPKLAPCPADMEVSTGPWSCYASVSLPVPTDITDECTHDSDLDVQIFGGGKIIVTGNYGAGTMKIQAVDLLNGRTYTVRYTSKDPCGNKTYCTFNIKVLDKVAPVAVAKQNIVVSLTNGGPNGDGSAKLYTDAFDNFSFDNCTDVHVEVRRADGAPACGNLGDTDTSGQPHNNNTTFNNVDIKFETQLHPNDSRYDTDGGQFVKFCCEDMTAITVDANGDGKIDTADIGYVQVFIRVWDDANGTGVYGDELNGHRDNYNETWTFVKVEDKLPPIIACPADATIYCDWGIDLSSDFGPGFQNTNQANFDKTGVAEAIASCGAIDVFFSDAVNLNDCGVGTIIRQFRATTFSKTGAKVVTCQQIINVLPRPTAFSVTPPNPNPLNVGCKLTQADLDRRKPTVTGGACDVIGENVKIDTFLFENGVCKKWVAEYNYFNWCTGEEMGPFFAYFVYEDTEKPVINDCADKMFGVDANCEHVLTLTNSASDAGGCTDNGWLKWQVFLDTWADGTVGHYASSFVSSSTYRNWKAVAGNDPILPGGVTYSPIVWVKYIAPTSAKDTGEVSVTFDQEPIIGKMSNHKVTWKVTDGCHNHTSCSYNIMVADKKAPTPYCVSLSTALMENGGVELWAADFNVGSFDNCTPTADLLYTFYGMSGAFKDTIITVGNRGYVVNADVPQYFGPNGFVDFDGDGVLYPKAKAATVTKYLAGDLQKWNPAVKSSAKVFDCDEYAAQGPNGVEVQMSVWDKKCNTDFCVVNLTLVDNHNACDPNGTRIAGRILTESGDLLSDATLTLEGNVNDLTRVEVFDGVYLFDFLPKGVDYTLKGEKDLDYMNGVSTLDIVLMQRHILGIELLPTAYKLVAADVNNDKRIRASDLVELRKLILGVTAELPNNTSWKLLDAEEPMDMNTPLVYSEIIAIPNLQGPAIDRNFMAVKIGDVSGNAKANARAINSDPRSFNELTLVAMDKDVKKGEIVSLEITAENFNEVFGYQFTMDMKNLTFSSIIPGALAVNDTYIGQPVAGKLTMSWNNDVPVNVQDGAVLFTLNFNAVDNGKLSNMLTLNSTITAAESYAGASLEVGELKLDIRSDAVVSGANVLYQNEPNPFKGNTTIAFDLIEGGQTTLTLYDVTGKVLMTQNIEAEKGRNVVELNSKDIRNSGVIYYQIEKGDFTATKKMVIIE